MQTDFEFFRHEFAGKSYRIALNKHATDSYSQALRLNPRTEPFLAYVLRRHQEFPRPLRFADFGANVGGISLPLAAHGLEILSVEALPQNFIALLVSARENQFTNLLPVNMAAHSRLGVAAITGESAWANIGEAKTQVGSTIVACATIATILEAYRFSDPDVIKIDIEGAELGALVDIDKIIAKAPDAEFIYESNTHTCQLFGHDQQALAQLFEKRGFKLYAFRAGGLMRLKAPDPKPAHLLNILATGRTESDIEVCGLKILPMTDSHLLASLLREAENGHPFLINHVRLQQQFLSPELRNSEAWERIAEILSRSRT